MTQIGHDSLKTRRTLTVGGKSYEYFSIPEAQKNIGDVSRLPVSLKVLLANILRFENRTSYKVDDAKAIAGRAARRAAAMRLPSARRARPRRSRRW